MNRLREKLWIRPLFACLASIAAALLAQLADRIPLSAEVAKLVPDITRGSIEDLLKITAASMLVIATFSVSSMVAAYASAANTATPRAFSLVVADDVSQNALSSFIAVFIFSVVALTALMNGYYGQPGRFVLFALTLATLGWVIATFVRWVDRIARLGRLGTVVAKVEAATADAMRERRAFPSMGGVPASMDEAGGVPVYASEVGYVQHVDMRALQCAADASGSRIVVEALPGTFATPRRPLARVVRDEADGDPVEVAEIAKAFEIGRARLFEDDPRFGLVVLSEIAGRALSPAVNDPGTAIEIIGGCVRLFVQWSETDGMPDPPAYGRVQVPGIDVGDMFDDAFTAIARDGAGIVEVQVRLQKALRTLASLGDAQLRTHAERHASCALARAEAAMGAGPDIQAVRDAAGISVSGPGDGG